ncbi:insulinase family protein [Candidatus Poribacteria bacterium]|nr:insulinase family protein [Candidatus Poribacteria bacterium]
MIKKFNCLYIIIIFLSLFISAYAIDSTAYVNNNQNTDKKYLQNEEVLLYVMENGMTVLIKEDHFSPVVALQIFVKTGSITEGQYLGSGISHFVEHMLFKGTKKRKVGDIPNEIREAGGTINAYTSYEETVYHTIVASQYFDIGLDVLSDAVMNSSFIDEEFNKEKDVILKEINMNEDSPGRFLHQLFWNTSFSKHPYRHPVIGYSEIFKKITREDLIKYYKEKYVPNSMIIVVVGDIDSKEVLIKIKEAFKDFQRGLDNNLYLPEEPRQLGKRELLIEKDVNVTHMIIGYHGPSIFDKDLYAMDVLSMILGQGNSSRLFKEIKEKKQLVYSVSAFSYTPNDPGIFGISLKLDRKNVKTAEESVINEIEKIKNEGVTPEELKKAVTQVESDMIFGRQTVEGQARTIASDEMIAGNTDFSKKYLEGISKVTVEDIKRVIDTYFKSENMTVVLMNPKSLNNGQKEKIKTQDREDKQKKPEIKRAVLSNGIRLLIMENHNIPIISIKAVFEGGVRFENEKNNGINNFMQSVIKKGTKHYTQEAFDETIESMGADFSTYSGNNSFGFNMNILKKDFAKGMELLHSVIAEPIFPEEEIEKERKNILIGIRTREDDVFGAASNLFRKTMFKTHPYRLSSSGEEDSVKSITREDIIKFYKSLCIPSNMVLAIYGDINSLEITNEVDNIFKDFKNEKMLEVNPPKEEDLKEITKAFKEKEDITQAVVFLGFRGIDIKNEDRYIFDVISNIYGDQGGRLFTRIREEQGLAYFVGTYSILGPDPGAYVFYVGTVPEKVDISVQTIIKEIERLKEEKVSQDELNRTKKNIIGERAIAQQTNESKAFTDALNELYGLGYNEDSNYVEKINKITPEDIERVAKQYFDLNKYVLTILKPKDNKKE